WPALASGARIAGCSTMFYSSPANLLSPGPARLMGEGWETARRRDDGNDWAEARLRRARGRDASQWGSATGVVQRAERATRWFVGNAPGWAALRGRDERGGELELLPRTRLQPDTPHRFRLRPAPAVKHVRLDVFPDGGLARLRLTRVLAPHRL